jgi:hypothetical protein
LAKGWKLPKNIDYKVGRIRKGQYRDEYKITIHRKGRMQMPIDLRVIAKNDSVHDYYIPNTWFNKLEIGNGKFDDGKLQGSTSHLNKHAVTLARWYGWDKLQPTYIAKVKIPSGIKDVIIDPSERLSDINMLNNQKRPRVEIRFDSHIYPYPSWKKYRIYMRPDVWWNAYDGFKLGVHANGNYMNVKHTFSLTIWLNTHLLQGRRSGVLYRTRFERGRLYQLQFQLFQCH